MASSGRGRATRVVAPSGPWTTLREERQHVVAWLLRSHRLLAADPTMRQVGPFLQAFPGGSWNRSIDATRISKWEITSAAPDANAVRRYEELLGLPAGELVSSIDVLLRYSARRVRSAPELARRAPVLEPETHARLAETVLAAHEGSLITGQAWDELTHFLAVTPGAVLLRPESPTVLAQRLLQEMVVADGRSWRMRYESFCRLLGHPTMGGAAIAACVELGSDPTNQVFIETWSSLESAPHPSAGHQLLRQLQQPVNDRAFQGALLGCLRKSALGHFAPGDVPPLVALLRGIIADQSAPAAPRYVALAVLRNLAPTEPRRTAPRPPTASMVAAQAVLAKVNDAVRAIDRREAFGIEVGFEDEMLPRVVQGALGADVDDERLYLSMAIAASPYRRVVAGILADQLAELHALGLRTLQDRVVAALRVIGGADEAKHVAALVTDESLPAAVRSRAAFAVGHMDTAASGQLATVLTRQLQDLTSGMEAIGTGIAYSLGVAGQLPTLRTWGEADLPAAVRTSVQWWLGRPPAVIGSVAS